MRILLVGNGNLKHCGARYYDQVAKLANGFTRNGHHVFFLSDRDIARFATFFKIKSIGQKYCNQYFLNVCRNYKPDMIVFYHADVITLESVMAAREILPAVKIAQFNVDAIFNPHTVSQISDKFDGVDATFITTAGTALKKFSRPGKAVSFVPNIVDASMEWPKCFEHSDQANDMFWALRATKGTVAGDRRVEYPLYLEQNGIKIDYYGMNGKPLLYDARYYECIANAKMGLNINQIWTMGKLDDCEKEEIYLYSSDRISHYLGSGLLVFTTRDNKLEELFKENEEMVFFASKEELLDKVLHYKKRDEDRKTIAKAGWQKAHAHYNERLIAQYIVETTFQQKLSVNYQWPTTLW